MAPLVPRVEVMSRELKTESVANRRYIIQNQIEHYESAKGQTTMARIRKGGRGGRGGRDRRGKRERRAKIGKVDEKRVKAVRVC
jgi:hypothetical protein